jgi:hypothetical protein
MKEIILVLLLCFPLLVNPVEIITWREYRDYIRTDIKTLQWIFTKKVVRLPGGHSIKVFIKPLISVEHKNFVINILHMTSYNYEQDLQSNTSQGRASMPEEVLEDMIMKMKIDTTTNAIGYIGCDVYFGQKKVIVTYFDNID